MNILLTGAWNDAKKYMPELSRLGYNIVFMQNESDELPCLPDWAEAVVCNGLFLSHNIEKFTNLRYIQLTSAGFDRVPMEYVESHNIKIYNARGVYSIPMAEFALCGVLQIYKKSRFFAENQRKCVWEKHRGLIELYGKTVCVVGCGSVGTECAKRFAAFGCKIIGVDLYPRNDVHYKKMLSLAHLDDVLPVADVVILTIPLTEETHHMFDRKRLSMLKNTAVLVNIARGAVVDTEALSNVLSDIGGAVLDVFEEEPLCVESPLWQKNNVIITPHNSFVGEGNDERLWEIIRRNLK